MSDENCAARANCNAGQLRRGKTVEQIYQKKTQLEHILLRPDTYVGSTEHQLQDMWVFDEGHEKMVHRKIDYVPALYKIFDEILVNAADNGMRDPKGMDLIDVAINAQQGSITVMNNGQGVPVQIHKEHQCYVPELIFGHLLTSDNYDDNEKKVTGGRNGYGAKLTNVFSKKFIVETADKGARKKFSQVFERNMSHKNPPVVESYTGAEFTRITFWPDLAKFGMTHLDKDIVGLMMKRVYDIAGSTSKKCRVVLNGKQLPIKCFQDYTSLYVGSMGDGGGNTPLIYERCSDRWEIGVSIADGSFQQVSFVNSINTIKGGTHVTHVTDQLVEALLKVVKGKNRGGIDIKPAHVRNHLWVFINCSIENPAFDSQTKETLTTKQSKFGSSCEIPEKMMKQVLKSGVVEMILDWVRAKEKVDISRQLRGATKNTTRVLGVPKLEDANDAGGRNSEDCTLILTEGDSAKALAVAGLSVVGRDKFGVFPLKGKVLNVRDANYKQVTGNTEIQNILKIMGLDLKCEYNSTSKLRYGSIMIMTDQDHDGSHIKGLLINLIHFWWPSLVRMRGFLKQFITPIVKVWKDGKKDSERLDERCFYTVNEYETWKHATNNGKGWKSKYYKGLGTSTMKEAKEYFKDIEHHEIMFGWGNDRDGEAIDLAFNKKRADDRKDWINQYEDGTNVDNTQKSVSYSDFVHKELVQFAKYDVLRSIPSVVDGFKPSQRKVLFGSFKKKLKNDIKVAQFVGYISEQAAYHHGEASLENTIVNLAQNFVGANNVNLLVPSGQFGTRIQGGKDHAAARYIYTRLHTITRVMFQPDDDRILSYQNDEGLSIEPFWYCPIIPTILVNGADGIGVGWATFVPNHNPREIICNIRRMLRGLPMQGMNPWYKGFRGTISPNEKEPGKFDVTGTAEKKSETTLEITELPLKVWTQNYKEFLEELLPQDGRKADENSDHTIEEFREYHTESTVHFVLTLTPEKMRKVEHAGLEKTFKLKSSIPTTNMVLFDETGKIAKYNSALDILREFCKLRLEMYAKRKEYLVAKLTREKEILSNKARFILMVVEGELELRRKKKADLLRELKQLGFTPMSKLNAIMHGKCSGPGEEVDPSVGVQEEAEPGAGPVSKANVEKTEYDYLLGMNLWSLTYERVEEIKKQLRAKQEELDELQRTSLEQMWDRELATLSTALDEMEAQEQEEDQAAASAISGRQKKGRARGRAAPVVAPPPRHTAAKATMDLSFLSRPLQTIRGADFTIEVQKTVWGTDAPDQAEVMAVDGADKGRSHAAEKPGPAAAKKRGRPPRAAEDLDVAAGPAAPPPPAAPVPQVQSVEETLPGMSEGGSGGSAFLRRLLERQGGQGELSSAQPGPRCPPSSSTSISEDLFSNFPSIGGPASGASYGRREGGGGGGAAPPRRAARGNNVGHADPKPGVLDLTASSAPSQPTPLGDPFRPWSSMQPAAEPRLGSGARARSADSGGDAARALASAAGAFGAGGAAASSFQPRGRSRSADRGRTLQGLLDPAGATGARAGPGRPKRGAAAGTVAVDSDQDDVAISSFVSKAAAPPAVRRGRRNGKRARIDDDDDDDYVVSE